MINVKKTSYDKSCKIILIFCLDVYVRNVDRYNWFVTVSRRCKLDKIFCFHFRGVVVCEVETLIFFKKIFISILFTVCFY